MNPVLVAGSVALDTVETPFGRRAGILGGAATHFALSARHFGPVRLVGVVGEDFPEEHVRRLRDAGIDVEGLRREPGDTFRWHGRYSGAMDTRETVEVHLGVFATFHPTLPLSCRGVRFAHLGTAHPEAQRHVLSQLDAASFVMLDTIDLWIERAREELLDLIPRIHALCVSHEEVLALARQRNLVRAARDLISRGLPALVVKRAEHGATLVTSRSFFSVPSYPTEDVVDPTGAGDAFAGGFLGFIASRGTDEGALRSALLHATVMGSFAVEGFGTEGLDRADAESIAERAASLRRMITL